MSNQGESPTWNQRQASARTDRSLAAAFRAGALVLALSGPSAWGTLYHCLDASGQRVVTDSPVQLSHCVPVTDQTAGPAVGSDPPPGNESAAAPPPAAAATAASSRKPAGASSVVTVPIRRIDQLLVVGIEVNGTHEAQLVLDTGASHTVVSPELASAMGLLPQPDARTVTLKTAGGLVEAGMVRVASLRIAQAEVRDSLAAVYALPDLPSEIDGLLGLSFLGHFEVTVDAARSQLHLRRASQ